MLPDDVRDVIEVLESTIDRRRSHMSEAVRGAIEGSVNALKSVQQALSERERECGELREALGIIVRNVNAGAVHASWCGEFAAKALAGQGGERAG